jgi:hypothetical protein
MAYAEIELRELKEEGHDTRYEVYDSDTGTPLGVFETYEDAQYELESLKSSKEDIYKNGVDADPGVD